MCVGFEKVQSDDPQPPDSLCNTFTKAREEGEASPPLESSDYTPLSPHSLGSRNELSRTGEASAAACSYSQPVCNLQSLLLSAPDFRQQVLECSSFLLDYEPPSGKKGLPAQCLGFHWESLWKNHTDIGPSEQKMKLLVCLFQRRE